MRRVSDIHTIVCSSQSMRRVSSEIFLACEPRDFGSCRASSLANFRDLECLKDTGLLLLNREYDVLVDSSLTVV